MKILVSLFIAFITFFAASQPVVPSCPPHGIHFIPYPGTCEKYILCFEGFPNIQECAPGLWFDQTLGACKSQSETFCPYTTTTTTTTAAPPTCPPIRIHPIAYPGYCDRYILCGNPVSRQCPPGLAFDPVLGECNDIHNCYDTNYTNNYEQGEQDIPLIEYE